MLMDQITEILSHMIGIFHTTLEEERMREVYEKFKALKEADPENDPMDGPAIEFKAKYSLEGFTPGFSYADQAPDIPFEFTAYPFFQMPLSPGPSPWYSSAPPPGVSITPPPFWGSGDITFMLEPPASVAVITLQFSFLTDNDTLLLGGGDAVFIAPEVYYEQLVQLEVIGAAIAAPVWSEVITPGETAAAEAIALHDLIAMAETSPLSGVADSLTTGLDVLAIHINGLEVDEMPTLKDLMPAYHQEEEEGAPGADTTAEDSAADATTEDDSIGTSDPDHVFPDPFEGFGPSDPDDPFAGPEGGGSLIVTGGNTLVNEVAINSSWLDAPVISVMGDAINLDVIIQVNVLIDLDIGASADLAASTVMNAASVAYAATTPDPDAPAEEAEDSADTAEAYTGLPAHWAVTRIEGDLIQFNQTIQYSFVTDFDQAEITLETNDCYIAMGDNTVLNLTSLAELGYGFDLIMVGGNMISMNWVSQVNVMLDNDTLSCDGAGAVELSGSDNLLYNGATINTTGVDSYGEMPDHFAAAGESFAAGGNGLSGDVARDSVFEGTELLRVLYIEGDLTTINWIDQTNVLGDSDQVHLAMENVEEATGVAATVTAGSNVAINVAAINEYGVDSQVSVGGDVYDDALLYQAELIDTDAAPTGVDLPALTSEAVVFLADHMVGPDSDGDAEALIAATATETVDTPDIMQSMLA